MTPAITVGIMTHNYGRFLAQAIESVQSQNREDWELIVSDDASTDDTPAVVQPFLSDPRIRYHRHEQNLGQAGNWAFLLGQGQAPVVAVLHADDYWLPGTLETVFAAFEADPDLDLLYGNWQRSVNSELEPQPYIRQPAHVITGHEEYRFQIGRYTCLPSATFLSRGVIERAGSPNRALHMYVDTEYFLRVALHSRRTRFLADPLVVYRVHDTNATSTGSSNDQLHREKELLPTICGVALTHHPALRPQIKRMQRDMARRLFSAGVSEVVQARPDAGRALMKRGLRLDTGILRDPKVAADCLLIACGPALLPVMQRLHPGRQASAGPQEAKAQCF